MNTKNTLKRFSRRCYWLLFALVVLGQAACLRLDDNLFNPNSDISAYLLYDFAGEIEVVVPQGMKPAPAQHQLFTLRSGEGEDEEEIYALFLGDTTDLSQDTVFLYFHGNSGNLDFYYSRAVLLANVGGMLKYPVLMIDYRGFGLSGGKSTEKSLEWDAEAAFDWLISKGVSPERMLVYGFSLGSIPAIHLAMQHPMHTLFLEAPIGSIQAMVQGGSGLSFPASFFTNNNVDNRQRIQSVTSPLVWFHGHLDSFLSLEAHGRPVFDAHTGVKSSLLMFEAEHGNFPTVAGFDRYLDFIFARIQ